MQRYRVGVTQGCSTLFPIISDMKVLGSATQNDRLRGHFGGQIRLLDGKWNDLSKVKKMPNMK